MKDRILRGMIGYSPGFTVYRIAMTIRIMCVKCQRKLKVPDEALGKKVQCPACGARFLGRLDVTPPPPMVSEPAPAKPTAAPFLNLQLEEPTPLEAIEPLTIDEPILEEPILEDEVEVTEAATPEDESVEPLVLEDEPIEDLSEVVDETDAIEEVDEAEEGIEPEIVDEEESAEEAKPRSKKKKSRGMLFVWLAIGLVLLLGCAGGGYAVYLYANGKLFESERKPFTPPVPPRPGLPPGRGPQPTFPARR